MAKMKPVWVRAYIPETNLANVKYGMKTKVLTDTINPQTGKLREYTGYVGYISPVAEFTPKTVQTEDLRTDLVYRIRVYIYDIDAYLRQGMPVTIKINLMNQSSEKTEIINDIKH
jgi:HlyD family secretion protein